MENQIENFTSGITLTKKLEIALDFGMQWFPNKHSKRMVYSLHKNGEIIHQLISTKILSDEHAIILFNKNDQMIQIKLCSNPKKTYSWATKHIVVSI
jgi:hypothetical protein